MNGGEQTIVALPSILPDERLQLLCKSGDDDAAVGILSF